MKFLIDHQLPPCLADFFRSKGAQASHVMELKLECASDIAIWAMAQTEGWVVVPKDEDFLHLAKQSTKHAKLLWVRIGNCRTAALLSVFERLWPTVQEALNAGEHVIELR